jgi:TRAP-type C4-dicarboxylate transport system permease small subunit
MDDTLPAPVRTFAGRAALLVLSFAVLAMMSVTAIDVIGRYAFNAPLPGTQEVTELLLALLVFGAAPLVTASGGHVTTELLEGLIRGRLRRLRDASVALLSIAVYGVLAWRILVQAQQMQGMSGASPMLHIPIGPILYFSAAMTVCCAAIALAQAAGAWRK